MEPLKVAFQLDLEIYIHSNLSLRVLFPSPGFDMSAGFKGLIVVLLSQCHKNVYNLV